MSQTVPRGCMTTCDVQTGDILRHRRVQEMGLGWALIPVKTNKARTTVVGSASFGRIATVAEIIVETDRSTTADSVLIFVVQAR